MWYSSSCIRFIKAGCPSFSVSEYAAILFSLGCETIRLPNFFVSVSICACKDCWWLVLDAVLVPGMVAGTCWVRLSASIKRSTWSLSLFWRDLIEIESIVLATSSTCKRVSGIRSRTLSFNGCSKPSVKYVTLPISAMFNPLNNSCISLI